MKRLNWQRFFFIIFIILLLFVTWQSLLPKPINAFQYASDKFLHFVAWFFIGISMLLGLNKYIWTACLSLLLYSIAIEAAQHLIPGRFFSMLDIVANGAGIIAALLASYVIKTKLIKNYRSIFID